MKNFQEQIKQFFKKTDKEIFDYLLQWWEIDSVSENGTIRLIGTYEKAEKPDIKGNEYGFFINVRSPKGDILYYPFRLGLVRIYTTHKEHYQNSEFLQIEVSLTKKQFREKVKNPFALKLDKVLGNASLKILDRIDKERFIKELFSKRGATPDDARTIANALSKLAGDLYTDLTERFVFELLQNADDMPNEKNEVNVKFIFLQKNLLFVHNGKPFDQEDIRAITDIGNSTKKKDPEQTGYKGIGFKVVFRESDNVLIKSGGYSFSFDKEHPFYSQLQNNLYEGLSIDEIPWQLKPIWTETYRYPREIKECEDFMKNSPVAIAIETDFQNIKQYKSHIKALFNEPRFILFLRKIKTIEVLGLDNPILIEKQKSSKGENYFILNDNEWIINDFEFEVKPEIREGMANDKIVPEKLKEIKKSKLSFACQIKEGKIESINPNKSFLFTYLPTNVNDYKFPFLVNADFLTTANRQSIHVKNIWNLYLFEKIGFFSFKWISEIAQNENLRFTITNLIPMRFQNNTEPILQYFNNGFDKAIREIAFLPTTTGSLCKVADALIDLTGFSEIIGYDLFVRVTNPNKILINNRLEHKSKLIGLHEITFFGKDELKKIFANVSFQHALTPQLLLEVLKFLQEKQYNFSDIGLLYSENTSKGLLMPSTLYFQTNQEDKSLLTFKSVYFLHPIINDYAEGNIIFKNWLISLGVNTFEGATFIRQHILNHSIDIDSQIKSKSNNLNFWRFIFNYELLESEVQKLSNYYVFDIKDELIGNITSCYLSDFYKEIGEPSVQQIAEDLGLTDFNFISSDYCQNAIDKSKWRKLFYGAGLKHSQNVRIFKDKIVPFIQSGKMDTSNYLKITKFVFDVFYDTHSRSCFDENLSNFQVLTTSGHLQPISQCILSDDYTQDLRLANILPEQVLPNQIHSIYLHQISDNRQNWKEFFLRLNPSVELTSADIVKRKISILALNPSLVTHQNVKQVWKTILSFKEDLLKTHQEELKKIPLLLKNNALALPTVCYFPKEYSPNTEIEELLTGYYDYFISPIFNTISDLSYSNLKIFFKQIGVEEEIRRSNIGNSNFDVSHKDYLSKFDFAKKFWAYFQKNQFLFTTKIDSTFKNYIQSNPSIPCLDGSIRIPNEVHSYTLKDLVNDSSVTCCIEFSSELESFLGIQQRLTVSKCFQILNSIAASNSADDKKISLIYDDLLYRFTNESLNTYSTEISIFKQNGKLLSNKDTFQSVATLFYQDVSANYLPLDDCDKVIKRFGVKDYWKKFEVVLKQLEIQIITVSDFSIDDQSSKCDAFELNKTLSNSIYYFAKKIDPVNFQTIENKLKSKLSSLKIYFSPNLKLSCSKLNYSPIVPNYYDTSQNTIYYSGNWNSLSNARLVEYLFKAFDITEGQISKEEFVSILLRNIPKNYEMPYAPPESLVPDVSTGRFGEEFVYKELVAKFGESRVNWLNKGGETYKEYDFEILGRNNDVLYFIDAKATTTGEVTGDTVPIYIRPSEWEFMQKCKDNYIVARVYNAKTSRAYTKYLKLSIHNIQENNL